MLFINLFSIFRISIDFNLVVAAKVKVKPDSHVPLKRTPSNSGSSKLITNVLFPTAKRPFTYIQSKLDVA